ncbi:MAG: nucleolar RNA-binding Nop10p family protein [Nitrososphaerota archaeon]|nr:nucleolar RNA-binding Nop10p family protein [Nitrososphaerota archaeon]MDG6930891.1 nucleolar RNA-binding Nop10p family protein [Nitrososphaerota archaeon]MDG6932452.1 nucleolar RNA-binding Nop10p family protein [Nitrososphaerota archaeon]MDG6936062.1 nucleolar RNA-binding Nop10p family protein [Nitrososphaerota archaeon]MDG6943706.1 nucleolar RNA-binding Nop10p family protein [Nitrososphaerota archaeon]
MAKYIKKCQKCGRYTIFDVCPKCGANTRIAHPPSFSVNDKYLRFRISKSSSN